MTSTSAAATLVHSDNSSETASPSSETSARGPIDHKKVGPSINFPALMRAVAQATGKGYLTQAREICRLALGSGRIAPFEYYYFRMFDPAMTAEEKAAFAGGKFRTKVTLNLLDSYFFGIGLDKLAFYGWAAGLGLPIPAARAVYHPSRFLAAAERLTTSDALEAYLRVPENYPFFSKPAEATASVGAAAANGYHPDSDELELHDGRRYPVSRFVEEAERYFACGYIFQERLDTHPEIARITGPRISTIRVMVLAEQDKPEVLRATWRLPLGDNVADVLWRGNMMAALDPKSGAIERVIKGNGLNLQEIETHPDTGARLSGYAVPQWNEIADLALTAASALPKAALTGWDIALTDRGPVLIELEPDGGETSVTQLASGKGLLNGRYAEFVERARAEKRKKKKKKKA